MNTNIMDLNTMDPNTMNTIESYDISSLFNQALTIYNQDHGSFYISAKDFHGLHLAVLPFRDEWIFSQYNFGDNDDVRLIWNLWQNNRIFKTFGCGLCPIREVDNVVVISNEQNQLELERGLYSQQIQSEWTNGDRTYIISGTVPQYYYSHLLFVSQDHIPTYNIFTDQFLFNDVFTFLQSVNDPNVTAIFNGGFGSDVYHFHLHLTNQNFSAVDYVTVNIQELVGSGVYSGHYSFSIEDTPINGLALFSTEIEDLYQMAGQTAIGVYILNPENRTPNNALCANFFVRNINGTLVNIIILQLIDKSQTKQYIMGCEYKLIAPGYILVADCFNVPEPSYAEFTLQVLWAYRGVYKTFDPQFIDKLLNIPLEYYVSLFSIPDVTFETLLKAPIEQVYNTWQYLIREPETRPPYQTLVERLFNIIISAPNCTVTACDQDLDAKIRYINALFITSLTAPDLTSFINNPALFNVRIASVLSYLYHYNGGNRDMISTDYLYFKGQYLSGLLRKTFKNLLLVTAANPDNAFEQTAEINRWLDFIYRPIGESSAMGVNTTSTIRGTDLDFVVKIMPITNDVKYREYIHELLTSIQVNEIRWYIPNFINCFGGILCNSSDITKMCDGDGLPFSYLLLENVKGSTTFGRSIKLPTLYSPELVQDTLDIIYQVMVALMFGWQTKQFTHYDLHVDNILIYDFIQNKNYLKLFKIYSEEEGDRTPNIDLTLFRYSGAFSKSAQKSEAESNRQYIVPAKKLALIIDYGTAYINGVPDPKRFVNQELAIKYGIRPDRPNKIVDPFTFLIVTLFYLILYKPYLIFDEKRLRWLPNNLSVLFYKFIYSYAELFKEEPSMIIDTLPRLNINKKGRAEIVESYFQNIIKEQYRTHNFKYLGELFTEDLVSPDFRGAEEIVEWMRTKFYAARNLETVTQNPNVYVFNWGYLAQDSVLQGIEPNAEIRELISERDIIQEQRIASIRELTERL